jgi:hypothetical protein
MNIELHASTKPQKLATRDVRDPLPKIWLWNRGLMVDALTHRGSLKKLCQVKFIIFLIFKKKKINLRSMKHSCRTDDKSTIVKAGRQRETAKKL